MRCSKRTAKPASALRPLPGASKGGLPPRRRADNHRPANMPTYEYHCSKCDKNFEVFQSMKDSAFKTCPEAQCQMTPWGHGEVKRLLGTGAGLIFKGSGFYITDYRSEGYKQAAKKDTGGGSAKETKSADKPASSPNSAPSGGASSSSGGSAPSSGGSTP